LAANARIQLLGPLFRIKLHKAAGKDADKISFAWSDSRHFPRIGRGSRVAHGMERSK
jgi:hypothetical protein